MAHSKRWIFAAVLCFMVGASLAAAFSRKGESPQTPAPSSGQVSQSADTVWVTRPDGAKSCEKGSGQSLDQGAMDLKAARVTVLQSRKGGDKLHAQMCGIPTGSSNAFLIKRSELQAALMAGFKAE